jgi:hypothetical protein
MSCLFNSLAYFVNINSDILRSSICDYIKTNPKILYDINMEDVILWENGKTLDEYVSCMRNTSTWGGGIEIKCFCEMFNLPVLVHFGIRDIMFLPNSNSNSNPVELLYNGGHYEPKR